MTWALRDEMGFSKQKGRKISKGELDIRQNKFQYKKQTSKDSGTENTRRAAICIWAIRSSIFLLLNKIPEIINL
jgi:hypothetical protein